MNMAEDANLHHFRFRAETLVDAVNLRRALYLLEPPIKKLIGNAKPVKGLFKMAILMPDDYPDIEVLLFTSYPIEFITKVMETIPDGHVMIETLREYEEYSGERTYNSNSLSIETMQNMWAVVGNTEDFFFRDIVLNTETLAERVVPYILALECIQKVINDIHGKDFQSPQIKSIESGSVLVSLVPGLGEAITAVDNFFRFRKKQAETELLEQQTKHEYIKIKKEEIEAEKEEFELKVIKDQWRIEHDPELHEADKQAKLNDIELSYLERTEELRRKQIENARESLKLLKEYVEVAEEFLSPYIPDNMPLDKKIEYVFRIIPPLQHIENSKLELNRGRPDTLPEFPLSEKDGE
jgi:hypothetical protein